MRKPWLALSLSVAVAACSSSEESKVDAGADAHVVDDTLTLSAIDMAIDPLLCLAKNGPPQPCSDLDYFAGASGETLFYNALVGTIFDSPGRNGGDSILWGPHVGPPVRLVVGADGGCMLPIALEGGVLSQSTIEKWIKALRAGSLEYGPMVLLPVVATPDDCTMATASASLQPPLAVPATFLQQPALWFTHCAALVYWLLDDARDLSGECVDPTDPRMPKCSPLALSYGLDMGRSEFATTPISFIVDRLLEARTMLFAKHPQWLSTHYVAAPGFVVDLPGLTRPAIDGGPDPRLRAYLEQASTRAKIGDLGVRVRARDGAETFDVLEALRNLADGYGWKQEQNTEWRVNVFDLAVEPDPAGAKGASQPLSAWRRGIASLVLGARAYPRTDESIHFHHGTISPTVLPDATFPADLTTGESPDSATAWRAAAWPLFGFSYALLNARTEFPYNYCLRDASYCGRAPPPGTPIPQPARRRVVASVTATPSSSDRGSDTSMERHVHAIAVVEQCVDDKGQPAGCFDRSDLRFGRGPAPRSYDLDGDQPTKLLRVFAVDERGLGEGAVGPTQSPTSLQINLGAGVARAWWRVSTMPGPDATFLLPPITEPVAVPVEAGVAKIAIDAGRPGAFLLEVVWSSSP